ncbi:MAG: PRC-barrel domain-containing protein [Nitrososphaerota archaeon]|nr:PRC-barrel domain-containing protein [Nitrososphaerota archaeon]
MAKTVLMNSDELVGKDIIDSSGTVLGQVKGTKVSLKNWRVTHLKIKLSSQASEQLGFKKLFGSATVCLPVSLVSAVGDVITINSMLSELRQTAEITECPE